METLRKTQTSSLCKDAYDECATAIQDIELVSLITPALGSQCSQLSLFPDLQTIAEILSR